MIDASRLQSLFVSALELPEANRAAFLEMECAGDAELLGEIIKLLAVDARLAGMTARPLAVELSEALTATAPAASLSGLRVGPFELREELGRGGMGSVYRAERVDGNVSQVVAIKFVRRELLDANTLKRFQLERQLMATLEHPNIARLLDAAELADGTPYYVMEYVAGAAITAYCDREKLSVRERVALLRKVCAAVAEAHRKLIVHRDLKPGNILIDAAGNPKLLDFGIAKPLGVLPGVPLSEETGTAQRYFSPHYAAPEQLTGEPVGVACDVYALGLLLFELLVGSRPFDFTQLSAGQIERLISEVPAPAPSVALARSEVREAKISARQLQGDLDGIVLRCLRKAPQERYASVEQLEADLGNYLDGRPVQARGGHRWYRVQKLVGRNKLAMASSVLLALTLMVGVVSFAWQARIAEQRAAELEQVSRFQAEMLGQVDPSVAGTLLSKYVMAKFEAALGKAGVPKSERAEQIAEFQAQWLRVNATDVARNLIHRTILQPAVQAIDRQFKDQPVIDAALRHALADRYVRLGMHAAALPLQRRALATRRRALGEDHPETLTSINALGDLLVINNKLSEAETCFREALEKRRRVLGEEHPDTLLSISNMGIMLHIMGKVEDAEPLYREALEKRRNLLGLEHPDTLASITNLGAFLQKRGRLDEAIPYAQEALELRRRVLGEAHPKTLSSLLDIGFMLQEQGKADEAEHYYRDVLEKSRRVLGEEAGLTLRPMKFMCSLLQTQGELSEAESYCRRTLEKNRRKYGADHSTTLISITDMGSLLVAQGNYAEAAELLIPAEAAMRTDCTVRCPRFLAKYLMIVADTHKSIGDFRVAEAQLLEANAILGQSTEVPPHEIRDSIKAIVDLYLAWHNEVSDQSYDARAAEWQRRLDAPVAPSAGPAPSQPNPARKSQALPTTAATRCARSCAGYA